MQVGCEKPPPVHPIQSTFDSNRRSIQIDIQFNRHPIHSTSNSIDIRFNRHPIQPLPSSESQNGGSGFAINSYEVSSIISKCPLHQPRGDGGGRCTHVMHARSRMTIEARWGSLFRHSSEPKYFTSSINRLRRNQFKSHRTFAPINPIHSPP